MLGILERVIRPEAAELKAKREKWAPVAARKDEINREMNEAEAELKRMRDANPATAQHVIAAQNFKLMQLGDQMFGAMAAERNLLRTAVVTREEKQMETERSMLLENRQNIFEKLADTSPGGIRQRQLLLEKQVAVASGHYVGENGDQVHRKADPKEVAAARAELAEFTETMIEPLQRRIQELDARAAEIATRIDELQPAKLIP